jgi:hypothetical protein
MSEIETVVGKKAKERYLRRLDAQLQKAVELLRAKGELPELSEKENMLLWDAVYDAQAYIEKQRREAEKEILKEEEEE